MFNFIRKIYHKIFKSGDIPHDKFDKTLNDVINYYNSDLKYLIPNDIIEMQQKLHRWGEMGINADELELKINNILGKPYFNELNKSESEIIETKKWRVGISDLIIQRELTKEELINRGIKEKTLEELEIEAVKNENFEEAAIIRDKIKELKKDRDISINQLITSLHKK